MNRNFLTIAACSAIVLSGLYFGPAPEPKATNAKTHKEGYIFHASNELKNPKRLQTHKYTVGPDGVYAHDAKCKHVVITVEDDNRLRVPRTIIITTEFDNVCPDAQLNY